MMLNGSYPASNLARHKARRGLSQTAQSALWTGLATQFGRHPSTWYAVQSIVTFAGAKRRTNLTVFWWTFPRRELKCGNSCATFRKEIYRVKTQ